MSSAIVHASTNAAIASKSALLCSLAISIGALVSVAVAFLSLVAAAMMVLIVVIIMIVVAVVLLIASRVDTFTHRLAANACSDFNVGLFENHAALDRLATCATILGSEQPLVVSIGELVYRDDALAALIIAAFAGTEPHSPLRLSSDVHDLSVVTIRQVFHACFGVQSKFARGHLDKGMALVAISDASLHLAEAFEDLLNLLLRAICAANEERSAEYLDVVWW